MIKVKNIKTIHHRPFCLGKVIFVNTSYDPYIKDNTINISSDPTKPYFISPIIISETEEILFGDKYLELTQTNPDRYDIFTFDEDTETDENNKPLIENAFKILALKENFHESAIEKFINGEIKHNDNIFVSCEKGKEDDEYVIKYLSFPSFYGKYIVILRPYFTTRTQVDNLYKIIKDAEIELAQARKTCSHQTYKIAYYGEIRRYSLSRICKECDTWIGEATKDEEEEFLKNNKR